MMIKINNSYYKPKKPANTLSTTMWDILKFVVKVPITLPRWIASFLLSRALVFIVLNPDNIKPQKTIHHVFLTDDPEEKGTVIVNLRPRESYKTLLDYLLKFSSYLSISSSKAKILRASNSKDKAHVDELLKAINLLIKGKSTAKNCENKQFGWEDIHFKGLEFFDEELQLYFFNKLTEQHGEAVNKPRDTHMEFFTLQTSDGARLDSVSLAAKGEELKPMSERKFVLTCIVRDQNFISWLKDFKYSADQIGCTAVSFNYRGIDYSQGRVWTQQNMIDDVLAQVDRLLALGATPENIGLEGQCLGGAIATIVAAHLHEKGLKVKVYNERSFRSLPHGIAGYFLPPANCNLWNPINWLRYLTVGIVYIITSPLVWLCGWSLDAESAWDKIPAADKDYSQIHNPLDVDATATQHDGIIEGSWASIGAHADDQRASIAAKQRRGQRLTTEEKELIVDKSEHHLFKVSPKKPHKDKNRLAHFLARRQLVQTDRYEPRHMHEHMVQSFKQKFSHSNDSSQHVKLSPLIPYQYNPHTHVKIWLSNNPNVFMNFENQMRLIEMREKNPLDVIHLVYDSSLLTEKACSELVEFCNENNIIPVDADKLTERLKSPNEEQLYSFYKDEIGHLSAGGNLAVASDIIRWISPIYNLGTYTDFDVPVDTTMLPDRVAVAAPLLLNIGSFRIGKMEMILANNDYVAIVDASAAKPKIEQIQTGIISKLTRYDTDFVEKTAAALGGDRPIKQKLVNTMKNRTESIYLQKSKLANSGISPKSSRELRAYLNDVTTDRDKFLEFNKTSPQEPYKHVIKRLRKELTQQLTTIKWFFFRIEYDQIKKALSQDDEKLIAYLMKKERSLYLKSIVVCTTGPIEVANSLFGEYVYSSKKFSYRAQPYSFKHYDLEKAFESKNSIPLHENIVGMLQFLGTQDGQLNDSSWLEEGRKLQNIRQQELEKRKKHLALNLPLLLSSARITIKNELKNREQASEQLSVYNDPAKRNEETKLLKTILKCFHQDTQMFDIFQFRQHLLSSRYHQKKLTPGLYTDHTRELIDHLEKIIHSAVIFRLAKDKRINLTKKYKQPTTRSETELSPKPSANDSKKQTETEQLQPLPTTHKSSTDGQNFFNRKREASNRTITSHTLDRRMAI